MTSTHFHVCYASVADALFEHIEQDLLLLTTVLIDDDEEVSFMATGGAEVVQESMLPSWDGIE